MAFKMAARKVSLNHNFRPRKNIKTTLQQILVVCDIENIIMIMLILNFPKSYFKIATKNAISTLNDCSLFCLAL